MLSSQQNGDSNQDLERKVAELTREKAELFKANKELQELDKKKTEFITVAAHQLRTPLAGIRWTLSMLLKGDLGAINADQKTFITKSYESNERMNELVNDLLKAEKLELGQIKFQFVSIYLPTLIDSVLFELSDEIKQKNIKVEFVAWPADLPKVSADEHALRSVVQNLLENAIHYTIKDGKVSIGLRRKDGYVEMTVADSGIGIPDEDKSKIFCQFFRAKNAVATKANSSGLGLFIAKSLVERHGGKIWFESKENVGTTFYFTIKI